MKRSSEEVAGWQKVSNRMPDARILRLNEQLKAVSGVFFNLGAATIGASAARTVLAGHVDWIGISWAFGALVLIWIGARVLTLLESEN